MVFERTKKLIEKIKPDLIITFNNRFALSLPILEVAKAYTLNIIVMKEEVHRINIKFLKKCYDVDERGDQIFQLWKNTNSKLRNKFGKNILIYHLLKVKLILT